LNIISTFTQRRAIKQMHFFHFFKLLVEDGPVKLKWD
jgi:hypothetical protein